ncbi:MAG: hypothetical protein HYZ79_07280, partial [Candidatus Melainabacteria bacterium]|nr:hypothetical protein [Candidatus Melainabacteria bacterium]
MNTQNNNIKKPAIFLAITLLIVFIVYFPSLNREWQFFDERSFYEESLFPIATSIAELIELIKTYAFSYHIGSQNTFFSNIITVRSNVLGAIMNMFVMFLFKKNSFLYHFLQLSIHLLNTFLVWKIFSYLLKSKEPTGKNITASVLSLIWALHPANIESVLLGTNWTSLVTYFFCFWFIQVILKKSIQAKFSFSNKETILYTFLFCISLLIQEYSYTLAPVLFFLCFYFAFKESGVVLQSLRKSFALCMPFFLGVAIFASYYLIKFAVLTNTTTSISQYSNFSLERFFFLTPQILVYFFKLFFYPNILSLYQTIFIKLSHSLFSPYSIFAFSAFLIAILLPIILFILLKSRKKALTLLSYSLLFSLFPFLHLLAPTYCLIADRYCYFPLFVLILTFVVVFRELEFNLASKKILPILITILLILSVRTSFRIKDWRDTTTLFSSDLKHASTNLDKGQIYSILVYHNDSIGNSEETLKYSVQTIRELNKALNELKDKVNLPEPKTLETYGIDYDSLLLRAAFSIADTRFNFLKEEANSVLSFYKPYIETYFDLAGSSHINLYSKLLKDTYNVSKAIDILEKGMEKYPYSPHLIFTLSNLYINQNEIDKAAKIIDEGYKIYPSYPRMLLQKIKLAELKNNLKDLAKYE